MAVLAIRYQTTITITITWTFPIRTMAHPSSNSTSNWTSGETSRLPSRSNHRANRSNQSNRLRARNLRRPRGPTRAGSPRGPTKAVNQHERTRAVSPHEQTRAASPREQTRPLNPVFDESNPNPKSATTAKMLYPVDPTLDPPSDSSVKTISSASPKCPSQTGTNARAITPVRSTILANLMDRARCDTTLALSSRACGGRDAQMKWMQKWIRPRRDLLGIGRIRQRWLRRRRRRGRKRIWTI
mmetsp:Transcript_5029/g.9126  ORF Transcript_5029/g.9126 Transcript_5029/m.9126 type:complete len:242 (+) Transcript_5029:547-1272(+)